MDWVSGRFWVELRYIVRQYIKRVLDANSLHKKFKIGRLLAVSLGLLDFVYLFSVPFFGDNILWNGFFACSLNMIFHILGIFLCDRSHCKIYICLLSLLIFRWELGDDIYGYWLGLKDLAGTFLSFFSNMSSTNSSWKGEIRFSQKSLTKGIVISTINDNIFN